VAWLVGGGIDTLVSVLRYGAHLVER
jgi:hypothetical protein